LGGGEVIRAGDDGERVAFQRGGREDVNLVEGVGGHERCLTLASLVVIE
jgi:hypothetical protein